MHRRTDFGGPSGQRRWPSRRLEQAEELYRQQQEKLQFTGRLITMGEMASTLAHELNQPLSAIASYSTACLNMIEHGDADPLELKEPLSKLNVQAGRAGTIIRRVHEFVRRSEPKKVSCSLDDIVEEAAGLIEADARKRDIRIVSTLAGNLPPDVQSRKAWSSSRVGKSR